MPDRLDGDTERQEEDTARYGNDFRHEQAEDFMRPRPGPQVACNHATCLKCGGNYLFNINGTLKCYHCELK